MESTGNIQANIRPDDFAGLLAALGKGVGLSSNSAQSLVPPPAPSAAQAVTQSSMPISIQHPIPQMNTSSFYPVHPHAAPHNSFGGAMMTTNGNQQFLWQPVPLAPAMSNSNQHLGLPILQSSVPMVGNQQATHSKFQNIKSSRSSVSSQKSSRGGNNNNWSLLIGVLIIGIIVCAVIAWMRLMSMNNTANLRVENEQGGVVKTKESEDIKAEEDDNKSQTSESSKKHNEYEEEEEVKELPPPSIINSAKKPLRNKKSVGPSVIFKDSFDVERNLLKYVQSPETTDEEFEEKEEEEENEWWIPKQSQQQLRPNKKKKETFIDISGEDLPELDDRSAVKESAAMNTQRKKLVADESEEVLEYAKKRDSLFK